MVFPPIFKLTMYVVILTISNRCAQYSHNSSLQHDCYILEEFKERVLGAVSKCMHLRVGGGGGHKIKVEFPTLIIHNSKKSPINVFS